MYKQQNNMELLVQRWIRTRGHGAIVYETCRPNLEKYKKGTIYQGIIKWDNLDVNTGNIGTFEESKVAQKKWMMDNTAGNI